MNDLLNVLYKPTLSHQDDALLWQEFHCTPKILKILIIVYILILILFLFSYKYDHIYRKALPSSVV